MKRYTVQVSRNGQTQSNRFWDEELNTMDKETYNHKLDTLYSEITDALLLLFPYVPTEKIVDANWNILNVVDRIERLVAYYAKHS